MVWSRIFSSLFTPEFTVFQIVIRLMTIQNLLLPDNIPKKLFLKKVFYFNETPVNNKLSSGSLSFDQLQRWNVHHHMMLPSFYNIIFIPPWL